MTEMHDRRDQILKEAKGLFSRQGFDRVTIKQLADACGITEPALYRHFDSKEAIYDAVLESLASFPGNEELFARLAAESDLSVILPGIARHILEVFSAYKDSYRLLLFATLREHARAREIFRSLRLPYVEFLKEQLRRLQAEGRVREMNVEISARCFVGSVFDCALSGTMWKGFQGRSYSPEEIIANNVPVFVRGFSAI